MTDRDDRIDAALRDVGRTIAQAQCPKPLGKSFVDRLPAIRVSRRLFLVVGGLAVAAGVLLAVAINLRAPSATPTPSVGATTQRPKTADANPTVPAVRRDPLAIPTMPTSAMSFSSSTRSLVCPYLPSSLILGARLVGVAKLEFPRPPLPPFAGIYSPSVRSARSSSVEASTI